MLCLRSAALIVRWPAQRREVAGSSEAAIVFYELISCWHRHCTTFVTYVDVHECGSAVCVSVSLISFCVSVGVFPSVPREETLSLENKQIYEPYCEEGVKKGTYECLLIFINSADIFPFDGMILCQLYRRFFCSFGFNLIFLISSFSFFSTFCFPSAP